MKRFFRTEDGFLLCFENGQWTDGELTFGHSIVTERPMDSNGYPVPGELIETKTGDELLNAIRESLAEADTDVVLRVANSVLSDMHRFLRVVDGEDIYEVVEKAEAVDAMCDRLGGDLLLSITLDNPMGGGSHTTWNVAALGKEIESMGGTVGDINTHQKLAERWCQLRGYNFLRLEVFDCSTPQR